MALTHHWSKLSRQQVGRYAEYFVKMELTLHGLDVYSAEVDDKGIDFIVRVDSSHYYDIQVKASRNLTYIFLPKDKFHPCENLLAAIVLFVDDSPPELFLIPSTEWLKPNTLLVEWTYEGLKGKPEYGLNLSQRNMHLLQPYTIDKSIEALKSLTPQIGADPNAVLG
jgi:hypothetical protein